MADLALAFTLPNPTSGPLTDGSPAPTNAEEHGFPYSSDGAPPSTPSSGSPKSTSGQSTSIRDLRAMQAERSPVHASPPSSPAMPLNPRELEPPMTQQQMQQHAPDPLSFQHQPTFIQGADLASSSSLVPYAMPVAAVQQRTVQPDAAGISRNPTTKPEKIEKTKGKDHWKFKVMKLSIMVLVIIVALSLHSVIERLLDTYIVSVSWTPERETFLRLLYPVIAVGIIAALAMHYSS